MGKVSNQYDYEGLYDAKIERLSDDARCGRNIRGFSYNTKTTKAGRHARVEIYPRFYRAYDIPRSARKKESTKAQHNLNHKKSVRYFMDLIHTNFHEGDIWSTHTFDDKHLPSDSQEAMKKWTAYIKKVNRHRAKAGLDKLKYVYVLEADPVKTRYHFHMICDGSQDRDELERLWTYGKRTQTRRIVEDEDTGLKGMATYIAKDETKYPARKKNEKRWSCSKGLKKPLVTEAKQKFRKRKVISMAMDREELMAALQKEYPKYKIQDVDMYINDIYAGIYIRIEMTEHMRRRKERRRQE